jgi:hypothetical protein
MEVDTSEGIVNFFELGDKLDPEISVTGMSMKNQTLRLILDKNKSSELTPNNDISDLK